MSVQGAWRLRGILEVESGGGLAAAAGGEVQVRGGKVSNCNSLTAVRTWGVVWAPIALAWRLVRGVSSMTLSWRRAESAVQGRAWWVSNSNSSAAARAWGVGWARPAAEAAPQRVASTLPP